MRNELVLQRRKQQMLDALEVPYVKGLIATKNRYIRAVAKFYETYRDFPVDAFQKHQKEIHKLSRENHERAIRAFARLGMRQVPKKGMSDMEVKETHQTIAQRLMAEWVALYGAAEVVRIAETTREDIRRMMSQAATQENPQEVAQDILKAKGFSTFRSTTIARTEIHNAAMFAEEQSVGIMSEQLSIPMKKKWLPVQDDRTRFDHSAMMRHPSIGLEELFTVGGEQLSRPGDPRGSAGNIINCRCTLVYEQGE